MYARALRPLQVYLRTGLAAAVCVLVMRHEPGRSCYCGALAAAFSALTA